MLQKKSLEQREHGNAKQIIFSETPSDDTLQGFSIAMNEDSESEDSTVSAAFAPYRVRRFEFSPSSSPLPYTVFAPTLFEFDPIK